MKIEIEKMYTINAFNIPYDGIANHHETNSIISA